MQKTFKTLVILSLGHRANDKNKGTSYKDDKGTFTEAEELDKFYDSLKQSIKLHKSSTPDIGYALVSGEDRHARIGNINQLVKSGVATSYIAIEFHYDGADIPLSRRRGHDRSAIYTYSATSSAIGREFANFVNNHRPGNDDNVVVLQGAFDFIKQTSCPALLVELGWLASDDKYDEISFIEGFKDWVQFKSDVAKA